MMPVAGLRLKVNPEIPPPLLVNLPLPDPWTLLLRASVRLPPLRMTCRLVKPSSAPLLSGEKAEPMTVRELVKPPGWSLPSELVRNHMTLEPAKLQTPPFVKSTRLAPLLVKSIQPASDPNLP